jgi:hypothetical protein
MDDILRGLIAGDPDEEDASRGLGSLSGLLGTLLGGASAGPTVQTAPSDMGDLLGMLGGNAPQPQDNTPQPGAGVNELIGMLNSGGQQPPQAPQTQQTPAQEAPSGMGGVLGMLGGSQAQPQQAPSQGAGLADLLGMLGGAQAAPQASSGSGLMGDLLGSLLGGGTQSAPSMTSNPLTSSIASALAGKLGISQTVANMIVGAAITLVLQSLQKRTVARAAPGEGLALSQDALDAPELGDVLKTLGGQSAGPQSIATRRATAQLAAQAGIDEETAQRGLAEAFQMLANPAGG